MQTDQVVEHLTSDVGNHPLTNPGHQIETHEGAHRQSQHQQQEITDGLIEQVRGLGHEPFVDQQTNALPHRQSDTRGNDQGQQGANRLPAIRCYKMGSQTNGPALTRRKHGRHPEESVKQPTTKSGLQR